jgi:hypothetical protein
MVKFTQSGSSIAIRAAVRFPAKVTAGQGIIISVQNGSYVFEADPDLIPILDEFGDLPAIDGSKLLNVGHVYIDNVSPTPANDVFDNGDLWFNNANGVLSIWYDDGTSTQWVVVSTPTDATPYVQGTARTLTGLATDKTAEFSNLPDWVKRVTVSFAGVKHNDGGMQAMQLQVGTGSPPVYITSGYTGSLGNVAGPLDRFSLTPPVNSSTEISGSVVLTNVVDNVWTISGSLIGRSGPATYADYRVAGRVDVPVGVMNKITGVKIFTPSATAAFASGAINISYE